MDSQGLQLVPSHESSEAELENRDAIGVREREHVLVESVGDYEYLYCSQPLLSLRLVSQQASWFSVESCLPQHVV